MHRGLPDRGRGVGGLRGVDGSRRRCPVRRHDTSSLQSACMGGGGNGRHPVIGGSVQGGLSARDLLLMHLLGDRR
jgi:hypothetical protein